MLSMLSLSISAIASQGPGGALPAAPLAAWPARLRSSFCLVFALSCSAPSLALSAPPRPLSTEPTLNKMAAVPSAGSPGARILRARRGPSETLYRPGGKSGRVMWPGLRDPSVPGTGSSAAVPPPDVAAVAERRKQWWRSQNPSPNRRVQRITERYYVT